MKSRRTKLAVNSTLMRVTTEKNMSPHSKRRDYFRDVELAKIIKIIFWKTGCENGDLIKRSRETIQLRVFNEMVAADFWVLLKQRLS
jgi:hypothetical protein